MLILLLASSLARAGTPVIPLSWQEGLRPIEELPRLSVQGPDVKALLAEDLDRDALGLPPRYAVGRDVDVSPDRDGVWESLPDGRLLWRVRLAAQGATSLSFSARRAALPPGTEVHLLDARGRDYRTRPLLPRDVNRGELWTPIVRSDDLVVEVVLPAEARDRLVLDIDKLYVGYRRFGPPPPSSGACNIDVACPEGDDWWDEIPSVAIIGTGGSTYCTGFMVNNTAEDQTPYFQTAHHCGITSRNAASFVAYWNYQSPTCGARGGGSLDQFQTGATVVADYAGSDFTLLLLDDDPDPDFGVTWAGWDHSGDTPTSAVCVHHPSGDVKSISFEDDPLSITSYSSNGSPGNGTHLRVADWDDGTTEGGSSGAPLFDQDHHVVGQLHGGSAACSNNASDWFGFFSASWTGGGTSSSRLSDWLDPLGTGQETLDTLNPGAVGLLVTPGSDADLYGPAGGPWEPASASWTVENVGDTTVTFEATVDVAWAQLDNPGTTLNPGQATTVTVTPDATAGGLAVGSHDAVISFVNTATHEGDTIRTLTLHVGNTSVVQEWDMSTDPGWDLEGGWAWGQPSGRGGEVAGSPDPSAGYTGDNVVGYNLDGDYSNNMAAQYATIGPIDASNWSEVSLVFQRWLGVEEGKYDHATVEVSDDGNSWTTVWENGGEVADSDWTRQELDISDVADGAATLWIRFGMGSTDRSVVYCGWNLDDVQLMAIDASDGGGDGGATGDGGADTGPGNHDDSGGATGGGGGSDEPGMGVCGCRSGVPAAAWAGLLLPLMALLRRRRDGGDCCRG